VNVDPTDTSGGRLSAFGRWLVRERELRGLARDEVVRATKLAPGVVEALESGEEGRIPPRAYVVGYLRAYASAVGLDADEVVLRFHEAAAGPVGTPGRGRRGKPSFRVALAVALAVAVAAAGIWALLRT
jgi:cytoskeletal protein RodZ